VPEHNDKRYVCARDDSNRSAGYCVYTGMKLLRLGASVTSVLAPVVLGAGLAGAAYAATSHPSAARPAASERTVVFDCPGAPAPEVKPSSYTVFCADGGVSYDKISWTSWTSQLASGTATLSVNTCTPDCAAGHFRSYPALLMLWDPTAVKGHQGEQAYTRMTVILPAARPSGFAQVATSTLPVY
jgi:hypothetical protein